MHLNDLMSTKLKDILETMDVANVKLITNNGGDIDKIIIDYTPKRGANGDEEVYNTRSFK